MKVDHCLLASSAGENMGKTTLLQAISGIKIRIWLFLAYF
jgi:hypothetical protein